MQVQDPRLSAISLHIEPGFMHDTRSEAQARVTGQGTAGLRARGVSLWVRSREEAWGLARVSLGAACRAGATEGLLCSETTRAGPSWGCLPEALRRGRVSAWRA